jgi:hypothetical protein
MHNKWKGGKTGGLTFLLALKFCRQEPDRGLMPVAAVRGMLLVIQ